MDAVGAGERGEVGAAVHEQARRRRKGAAGLVEQREERAVVEVALAHLQRVDAELCELRGPAAERRRAEEAAVTDREESGRLRHR